MVDDQSQKELSPRPERNALASFAMPKMDLVGPTVDDDIRRVIWRYGAEAVKNAVKKATKAKLGRKKEPDWPELREIIEADARDWLAGNDPFAARTNYAIAKAFAERTPGQSAVSTHKRIERKLSKGPYDRRWFTLASAEIQSRDAYPFEVHIRALEALSELPESSRPEIWKASLDSARATVADYEAREGKAPAAKMTFREIEEAVRKASLAALIAPPPRRGLFANHPQGQGVLGKILNNSVDP